MTDGQRQKPGSTPKGQQRSFAYENMPNPLQPLSFIIRILDIDLKPIQDKEFQVKTSKVEFKAKTDFNGILRVPKSGGEITLSSVSDNSAESSI